MNLSPKQRLFLLLTYTKKNITGLSKQIGCTPQNFYDINNGKHSFTDTFAQKIVNAYPEINKTFLTDGNGTLTDSPVEYKEDKLRKTNETYYLQIIENQQKEIDRLLSIIENLQCLK